MEDKNMRCANCDKIGVLKTAYGDRLCEDCWDEYICTRAGMLEHLIGICKRDYHDTEPGLY